MEDRPTEVQRPWGTPPEPPPPPPGGPDEPLGPPPGEPPPPWYREYWWIWLIVLLLVVGGIIAFFALRDSGGESAETQTSGPPEVPNLIGTQEEFARNVLAEDGFEVEVVRQPSDQREGVVVEQDPEAGSKVAQGSTVRIVVSTGPPSTTTVTNTETVTSGPSGPSGPSGESGESGPETVEMPDVAGDDYVDAVDELVDAGVLPDFLPIESSRERGTVLKQSPAAGEQVEKGATVRLDVALGEGEREDQEIPDFQGKDVGDALKECAEAGFACRTIAGGPTQRDVVGQDPAPGGTAPALTIVNLLTGG